MATVAARGHRNQFSSTHGGLNIRQVDDKIVYRAAKDARSLYAVITSKAFAKTQQTIRGYVYETMIRDHVVSHGQITTSDTIELGTSASIDTLSLTTCSWSVPWGTAAILYNNIRTGSVLNLEYIGISTAARPASFQLIVTDLDTSTNTITFKGTPQHDYSTAVSYPSGATFNIRVSQAQPVTDTGPGEPSDHSTEVLEYACSLIRQGYGWSMHDDNVKFYDKPREQSEKEALVKLYQQIDNAIIGNAYDADSGTTSLRPQTVGLKKLSSGNWGVCTTTFDLNSLDEHVYTRVSQFLSDKDPVGFLSYKSLKKLRQKAKDRVTVVENADKVYGLKNVHSFETSSGITLKLIPTKELEMTNIVSSSTVESQKALYTGNDIIIVDPDSLFMIHPDQYKLYHMEGVQSPGHTDIKNEYMSWVGLGCYNPATVSAWTWKGN